MTSQETASEWVHETTPSLLPAVRQATDGLDHVELEECPLLVLPPDTVVPEAPNARALDGDDPDLAVTQSVIHAGFEGTDELVDRPLGSRPELIRAGLLVVVAAYDCDRVVAGGSAAPRDGMAELMGIAVPPAFRRRGLGSAVTRGLVHAVRTRGARTILLSAASDNAASIYREVGFVDVGTACILGVFDGT